VAGVDGCAAGWIVVLWHPGRQELRHRRVASIDALDALHEALEAVGLDMVIGVPERAESGGRRCDRMARQLLGHPRSSSVFSPPVRAALQADTFEEAQALQRQSAPDAPGLTIQTFHLLPKIRAVDAWMTPGRQRWVREVHPELAFYALSGGQAVSASKHTDAGRARRLTLLADYGPMPDVEQTIREAAEQSGVEKDDALDAGAACWTAGRIAAGTAERLPPLSDEAPQDARGLRMEIWR
jgi:predicted RNase H-like nuclease